MARKVNQETVVDPYKTYSRVWTFRTQELMDLWINEMRGQISDGKWENSRGTQWLCRGNDICKLGDKTELTVVESVYCLNNYKQPKMNYPLTKDLIDVVGDLAIEMNGFANLRALKEAWKEIAEAIQNPRTGDPTLYNMYVTRPAALQREKERGIVFNSVHYIENNLADLIQVNDGWLDTKTISSKVSMIGFHLNQCSGKVEIKAYKGGKFEATVEPEKVRTVVEFIQNVIWK